MKIKRIISGLLSAVIAATLIPASYAAHQFDDEVAFELFYDFEDYHVGIPGRINKGQTLPDSYWEEVGTSSQRGAYGSLTEDGNTAMLLGSYSTPFLWFDRFAVSGKLHISYDFKFSHSGMKFTTKFQEGWGLRDHVRNYSPDQWSFATTITGAGKDSSEPAKVQYFAKSAVNTNASDMTSYNFIDSDVTVTPGEYHRFDMITTELSGALPTANFYIDGVLVNQAPVGTGEKKGFRGISLAAVALDNATAIPANDYVLVDNLRVSRYYHETGLRGSVENGGRVDLENGEIQIKLSEDVDTRLLVKENVKIEGRGGEVSNFDIKDVCKNSFTVAFDGEIISGKYTLSLAENVVGSIFKLPMVEPVTFRTKDKVENIRMDYLTDDFESYTEDLSDKWTYIPQIETTPFKICEGNNSEKAIGVEIKASESDKYWDNQTRIIRPLDKKIGAGNEFNLSFDIKSSDLYWYLYLAEDGDLDSENSGYDKNIAIAGINGKLYYAKNRTNSEGNLTRINGVSLAEDSWHNIKMTVIPKWEGSTYKISVDGGEEYEVSTNREFYSNDVVGVGLGFLTLDEMDSSLFADNFKMESSMNVVYPEVDDISWYTYENTEVPCTGTVTSTVSSIKIDFNTEVDSASAREKIKLIGEIDTDYFLEFIEENGCTEAWLNFPQMLKADCQYSLVIEDGIKSALSEKIASEVITEQTFKTTNDGVFNIFKNEFNTTGENPVFEISIAKNDKTTGKYTIMTAVYEKTNGFEKLVGATYVPFVSDGVECGVYNYEIPVNYQVNESSVVKTLIWSWPDGKPVELSGGSTGNVLN